MDKEILKEIGLQEGESKVYLELLKSEEFTASELTKNTNIHRSNTYDILEKLQSKGLVSFVIKNNIKYFRASNPNRILDYIKEKEEKVKSIIPDLLKRIPKEKEGLKVEVYKGKEGIKTVLKDILKESKEYLLFGKLKFEKIMPIYVEQFVRQLNEKKIKERAILEKGEKIMPPKNHDYRYIKEEYLFPNATIVYGNKVAIFAWEEPGYVILMNSKDISSSYKIHFEILWKIARK